jgi:hypothetical protein
VPEFAPAAENHLLGSTSVVQKVAYGERAIRYTTFDRSATEVLRLNFKPAQITAGGASLRERDDLSGEGYTLRRRADGEYVVRVRHEQSNEVSITG